jgi:trehalose-phosphatase
LNVSTQPFSSDLHDEFSPHSENRLCEAEAFKMIVCCLALDYDGTISPLDVSRSKSRVPEKTFTLLQKIGRLIPIVIVTTKDLSFVTTRTPFAHAWSAVSGLERKIDGTIQKRRGYGHKLENVSLAIEYAKSHITDTGVEIEEKHNMSKRPIAFCVDWRQAGDAVTAMKEADAVADCCEALGLKVMRHGCQPFLDVYPMSIDKGVALKEMLKELKLKNGVLYLGDSEADNPAFEASDVSVGVVHENACPQLLACDYVLKFEDVFSFLSKLLANSLLFDSRFPMIQVNLEERGKDA